MVLAEIRHLEYDARVLAGFKRAVAQTGAEQVRAREVLACVDSLSKTQGETVKVAHALGRCVSRGDVESVGRTAGVEFWRLPAS
jgi:hypothetical protein